MRRGLPLPVVHLTLLIGAGTASAIVACGSDDPRLLGDSLDAAAPDAASTVTGAVDAGAAPDAAASSSDPVPTSCTCSTPTMSPSLGYVSSPALPCGAALCVGLKPVWAEWKCFDAGVGDYVSPPVDCEDAGPFYGDAG